LKMAGKMTRLEPLRKYNLYVFLLCDYIDDFKYLSNVEKNLIGFCINSGSAQPKKTVAKYNCWNRTKSEIAKNLYKIRHWKVFCGSYLRIKNKQATWFIDPPYQYGGQWYQSSVSNKHINYKKLAIWCKTRRGQTIVCENVKANWLIFKPLIDLQGQLHKTTEAIWTNDTT